MTKSNRNSCGYYFRCFGKCPWGMSAIKSSVKFLLAYMGFVNYSGIKFSPDFPNTETAFLRCSTEVVVYH